MRVLKHAAYPTLAEAARHVAAALDVRMLADPTACDRMDRAAATGDFDLELFEELVENVLYRPLESLGDEGFAYELAAVMRGWRREYIRIVGRVSSDALSRDELLPLLVKFVFAGWVADVLKHLERSGLIRSALLMAGAGQGLCGDPPALPVATVIQTFLWQYGAAANDAPGALYPQPDDGSRDRASEQVARWMSGAQLPSLGSIRALVATAASRPWFRATQWPGARVAFQRELLTARALQYSAALAAPYGDFLQMVRDQLDDRRLSDIGLLISRAVYARGKPIGLSLIGLQTVHALDFREPKTDSQLNEAEGLLDQFRAQARHLDAPWAVEWMVTWCEARLAAWRSDFRTSVELYERAFAASVYRSGREAQSILIEALTLASSLGKRPHMKRLIHQAKALDILPRVLGDLEPQTRDGRAIADILTKCYAPYFPRPTYLSRGSSPQEDAHDQRS
jgi:hypothetical protein